MPDEYTLPKEYKLVRVISVGSGSKSITIPADLVKKVLGGIDYVAIYEQDNKLVIQPVELIQKNGKKYTLSHK